MEDEKWLLIEDTLPKDALQLGALVWDYKNPAQDRYFSKEGAASRSNWYKDMRNMRQH